MKDLKIKIILTLSIILTVITIWTWIQNLNNIDIAATKNRHSQSRLRLEINSNNDPEFLKEKALSFLDSINQISEEKSKTASNVSKSLIWIAVFSILTTIVTTVELVKRGTN